MFHRQLLVASRVYIAAMLLALLAGCNVPEPAALSSVAPPTNLSAVAGDAHVTLTWTASTGATSYNIKRSVNNGGPFALIATSSSTTYTDASVTNGVTYFYVVSSQGSDGEGVDSPQTSAQPTAPTVAPGIPLNVVATPGDAQISLTWSTSTNAASYRVKRASVSGGPYIQIATPTTTAYTDAPLTNGTTYYYVISAVNAVGESADSTPVASAPSPPPPTVFGTWTDVTPAGIDLVNTLCANFGAKSAQVDLAHPSNVYVNIDCQGIWRSTDYGATWTGPINTGTNGAFVTDCNGGITVAPDSSASVPTIYTECGRGSGQGFWKSVDGGVNWTKHVILSNAARQDYFPPVVDPYDLNHLLMTAHEFDSLVESIDGGVTWSSVHLENAMLQTSLNSTVFFVNTGNASTTRDTWLWTGQANGGAHGMWRTVDSGANWVQVDKNEGTVQIYQPNNNGIVFVAGYFSDLGNGVLRSTDYGQTWMHVGPNAFENIVFGTAKNMYAMNGFAVGPGGSFGPGFEVASQPGTGIWVTPATPSTLTQGPSQVAVLNDGTHSIFVGAMYNSGVWRYVEP